MKKIPKRVKIQNIVISKSVLFSIFQNINIEKTKKDLLELKNIDINFKNQKEMNKLPKKVKELIIRSYLFSKADRKKAAHLFFKKISKINQSESYKEFYE